MGSPEVNEAKMWLQQELPIAKRIISLLNFCREGNLSSNTVIVSEDIYERIIAEKSEEQLLDLGLSILVDKSLPLATMWIHK